MVFLFLQNQRIPADMVFLRTSEKTGGHLDWGGGGGLGGGGCWNGSEAKTTSVLQQCRV